MLCVARTLLPLPASPPLPLPLPLVALFVLLCYNVIHPFLCCRVCVPVSHVTCLPVPLDRPCGSKPPLSLRTRSSASLADFLGCPFLFELTLLLFLLSSLRSQLADVACILPTDVTGRLRTIINLPKGNYGLPLIPTTPG